MLVYSHKGPAAAWRAVERDFPPVPSVATNVWFPVQTGKTEPGRRTANLVCGDSSHFIQHYPKQRCQRCGGKGQRIKGCNTKIKYAGAGVDESLVCRRDTCLLMGEPVLCLCFSFCFDSRYPQRGQGSFSTFQGHPGAYLPRRFFPKQL